MEEDTYERRETVCAGDEGLLDYTSAGDREPTAQCMTSRRDLSFGSDVVGH